MRKKKRNYRKEYDNYQGKRKQKKNRAARNASRAKLKKPEKYVHHKDGNPRNKKRSNLKVTSKRKNRSFKRTKTARKKR